MIFTGIKFPPFKLMFDTFPFCFFRNIIWIAFLKHVPTYANRTYALESSAGHVNKVLVELHSREIVFEVLFWQYELVECKLKKKHLSNHMTY